VEWLVEATTLGVLLFWIFYLTTSWDALPETVPKRFNFAGQARGVVSREFLWLLPGVGVVSYVLLTLLSRFPHIHNYPTEVTAENAEKLYGMSRSVLTLLKFQLVAAFGYIEWKMVQTARGAADGLHPWFMGLLVAAVLATSVYPMIQARRQGGS